MEESRDFKGIWIPKEIWLSSDLTLQEKVFLVEIDSLDNENSCYANNKYFADFFGLSKTRVSLVIKSLIEKGYITSTIIYKEGSKQILKRVLKVCYRPYLTKVIDPTQGKLKDNNILNNTVNNIINNTSNKGTEKEPPAPFKEILTMFNNICVSYPTLRKMSDERKKHVRARLKDYTLDDFEEMFKIAEASSFLKGNNPRKWRATFDWLMNDSNMTKVLEGNYNDKDKPKERVYEIIANENGGPWS